jgi:peptide/nickel transport system substrate-binding protein
MRMALEYAIDKQTMVEGLGRGFNEVSNECIAGIWQVPNNNPSTTPRKYDVAKAAQLIKDAGYDTGLKVSMELNTKFMSDFVTATQSYLSKVGINVDINLIPDAAYQSRRLVASLPNNLRFERGRGSAGDPLTSVNNDLASSAVTYPGLKRPDGWDALLNQALQEPDSTKILAIMNQMEQKAYGEAFTVPIYIEYDTSIWSPKLKSDRGSVFAIAGIQSSWNFRYDYWTK